ncbi:MAG: tetratricopeptide repeat-containing sensor histidine kinase, partial [Bacteroidales bacterium]|nr:tetratricopeptide repeat-containing sensor histidine kinase [Bacteroidales bacterium]
MQKIKLFGIISILLCALLSFAQGEREVIDSLFIELEKADDKSKIEILNNLSRSYWDYSVDSSFFYANEALNLAHIVQDDKGISDAYNRIGDVYSMQNENKKALEFYLKCLDMRLDLNDSKSISNIYNNIGLIYDSDKKYGLALEYFYLALKESKNRNDNFDIADYYSLLAITYRNVGDYKNTIKNLNLSLEVLEELDNKEELAFVYNDLGNVYGDISSYEEALEYSLLALEIFEDINNRDGISMTYNSLGIIYQSLNENDKALEYLQKTLQMEIESGSEEGQAMALNNIGTVYDNQGDKEKALDYYNQALKISKELEITDGVSIALNNIGLIYLDLGNYEKAYTNLMGSTEISKEINDIYSLANNYNNLANLFLQQKKCNQAQDYLGMASELAVKINAKEYIIESYELYSKLYTEQNNYEKALKYHKLYTEMHDSVMITQNSSRLAELKVKFDTDYIESENKLLKKDNEIHVLELDRQKNIMKYWIAFSILILVLAILSFNQFRLKKKTNSLLKNKNDQLRDANKKLIDSELNLKELNATKDKFFSIIAHDLKNPFQSLLGFSEILYDRRDQLKQEEINEYSRLIFESSQNLYSLLGNLLQWAKTQLGNTKLSPKNVNIYESLNDILDLFNLTALNKNINIINLIEKDTYAFVDKHVASSVFSNLISNAIKFTNQGGEIKISCKESNNRLTISVLDNGNGISEGNINKLFRIDQGYSTKGTENESGTGLGLILCKEFVEKHGGK